jgi:hypothetical protein
MPILIPKAPVGTKPPVVPPKVPPPPPTGKGTLIPKAPPSTKSKFELIPKTTTTGSDKVLLQVVNGTNGHSVEIFHMLSPTQTFPYFDNCIKCGFQSHEITLGNAIDTARKHVGF